MEESIELYTCKESAYDSEIPADSQNSTVPRSYNELATLMSVTGRIQPLGPWQTSQGVLVRQICWTNEDCWLLAACLSSVLPDRSLYPLLMMQSSVLSSRLSSRSDSSSAALPMAF